MCLSLSFLWLLNDFYCISFYSITLSQTWNEFIPCSPSSDRSWWGLNFPNRLLLQLQKPLKTEVAFLSPLAVPESKWHPVVWETQANDFQLKVPISRAGRSLLSVEQMQSKAMASHFLWSSNVRFRPKQYPCPACVVVQHCTIYPQPARNWN